MPIVADEYAHVIGVDTHARTHTYVILDTRTGGPPRPVSCAPAVIPGSTCRTSASGSPRRSCRRGYPGRGAGTRCGA